MWRISALPRQSLAAQWLSAVTELPQLLSQLRPYMRPSTNTLVANISSDASYLLFESPLSAEGAQSISWAQLQADPVLYATWQQRQREYLQALEPHLKTMQLKGVTQYIPNAACLLKLVLTHPQHLYVVNGKDPVVLPFYDQAFYQKLLHEQPQLLTPTAPAPAAYAAAANAAPAAATAAAAGPAAAAPVGAAGPATSAAMAAPAAGVAGAGTAGAAGAAAAGPVAHARPIWPWVLLGLLLLLGLFGLLWWLWQHMNAEKAQAAEAELAQSLASEEQLLDQNLALQREVAERIALAQDLRLLAANRALLQEVEAKLKDAERLSLEQALSADTATLKQNLLMQDLVQALLAAAEAKPAVPAAPAATADKGASAPAASAVKTKRLPKCEVIVKEGKVPQLVMAIDGSGSMLNVLPDGKIRMAAAQEAANALISRVDRNVPIHLLGIQGCPLARDYGVFTGAQRQRLTAAITQLNPLFSPSPLRVLTPLVSAMRGMAGSVPANTDAVGILISDGVDTCSNTRNLDLCAVAREIHAQKPKLKIHVVLVGDEAPEAKCVAAITGGRVFHPGNTSELVSALKTAGQTLERVCE